MGWILAEYGIKRIRGDLIQPIFHVFGLKESLTRPGPGPGPGGFAESLALLVLIPLNIHTPKIATLPLQGDYLGGRNYWGGGLGPPWAPLGPLGPPWAPWGPLGPKPC